MLLLLFGTHLYFTARLGIIQRKIPLGIRLSVAKETVGAGAGNAISPYSALATALAATIGTGNIIGISTAIAVGGPGAVFWCWITGLLGIATCYAESFLAVRYKVQEKDGMVYGGPMYVLERGANKRWLAVLFSIFTAFASFGIGSSVQAHSICTAAGQVTEVSEHVVGIVAGVLAGLVIVGGRKKIAAVCTWLVPVMSALYLGGCVYLMFQNLSEVPRAVGMICRAAFCGKAVVGGIVGRSVLVGMRTGISRGLFTNEAGLGSIPMTAAATGAEDAARQALISMTGPFWDTVVMCAVTGIALLSSMLGHPEQYQGVSPEKMCFAAFRGLPVCGELLLSLSLILFAFATIIGWNVYGVAAVRYLWGEKAVWLYQGCYLLSVYAGAVLSLETVWGISDLFNVLMAVPNLIGVFLLRNEVRVEKHFQLK